MNKSKTNKTEIKNRHNFSTLFLRVKKDYVPEQYKSNSFLT